MMAQAQQMMQNPAMRQQAEAVSTSAYPSQVAPQLIGDVETYVGHLP